MIDAAKVLSEIIGLLGGIGGFLGIFGLAMVLLTLLILAFINAISPASRQVNFFLAVGLVSVLALFQALQADKFAEQAERLLPYFTVMAAPYLLTMALTAVFQRATRPKAYDRMKRIETLTDELHSEIEAMKKWG